MIILIGLSVHSAWCQPVILKGRVLDVNTRNEIPFANIFVKGENLLAQRYEINTGYPMPKATFMGGINLNF